MKRIKKGLAFFLATWIWMLALPVGTLSAMENTAEFLGGDGTEESPYLISNKTHLNNVRNHLDAHFLMVADIEFNEADFAQGGEFYNAGLGWKPIGMDSERSFSGLFDGGEHEIIGLQCTRIGSGSVCAGLFGYSKGTIQNLGMVDSHITGTTTSASWRPYVGGIVGYHDGVAITNCYNTGSVSVPSAARATFAHTGGIVGYHNRGTISGCRNAGRVFSDAKTDYSYVGGIAGYNIATLRQCHNTGTVQTVADATYFYAGGIAGYSITDISGCDNAGAVLATPPRTGLICCAGGIVGHGSRISLCYNTGEVSSKGYAGGITGENNATLNNSYNSGTIRARVAGGIAGTNKSTISICYNTGNVFSSTSHSTPRVAGGIAAVNDGGTIKDCYNTGDITSERAGGIVGDLDNGTISSCYNAGRIFPISGYTYLGGILGANFGGTVQHSYYLDTAIQAENTGSAKGVACTEEQMQSAATFAGFDFDRVWQIDPLQRYRYPQLSGNRQVSICGVQLLTPPDNNRMIEGMLPDLTGATLHITYTDGWEAVTEVTAQMLPDLDVHKIGVQTVRIFYGKTLTLATIDIEVLPKSIVGIEVTALPKKTTYVQGQPLNVEGGQLTVHYNNNTSKVVELSETALSYPPDQTGEVTVEVTYQGAATVFMITVLERTLQEIRVVKPDRVSYIEGQALDLTGGKLQIIYMSEDHYTEEIPLDLSMVNGFDSNRLGKQEISVTYGGKTTVFTVDVAKKSLTGIEITRPPVNMQYLEGETLELDGMEVTGYYNNGTSVIVTDYAISGYDSTPGIKTITVTYDGKSATFEVTVKAKSLTEIKVTKEPTKLGYLEGNEFDPTGMEVTAYYDNGAFEVITGYTISGYDSTSGTKTITVTYDGKSATFEVTVKAKSLTEIKVTKEPTKLGYLEGNEFDPTGMEVTAYYDNGASEVIAGYAISGYDSTPGVKRLTVTYGGKTATFEVTVRAKALTEIRVTKQPAKRTYLEGDAFDSTGMEITAYYDNGTSEVVTDYGISGYDSTPGVKRLTVVYGGKTAALEVTVRGKALVSIAVTKNPDQMTYVEGTALDTTGMELTLVFDNGTKEVLATGWTETYDFSQPGRQEVRIDCRGKTTTLTVMVLSKALTGIAVSRLPNKLTYIEGNAFSAAGMEVTAYYDNNTSEIVTDRVTIQGYDSAPGIKTMAISYQGKEASFTVTVEAKKPVSIAWKAKPNKTVYFVGEELSLSGAVILIRYNNGTTAEQKLEGSWGADQYNPNQIGTQTIYIRYQETPPISFTVTVKSRVPSSITSGTYSVGGGFLSKVGAGTTAAQLLGGINEKDYCKVYKGNTEVTGNALVGTGMAVKLLDGGTVKQTAAVVVTGDTNGDGQITITDMLAVKAHVLKKSALAGAAAKAADTSGDKVISITDFIQIKAHILGKDKIQPRAC